MTIQLVGKNMQIIPYTRIGGIIPKNCLTLVTGLPSTGKSFTILKFLNSHGIKPFLFNLDYDPTLQSFDLLGSSAEYKDIQSFIDGEVEDLEDQVIIIDTYTRFTSEISLENSDINQKEISTKLSKLCREKNYTLIIIGHVEHYATKSNIFKDNPYLVRDCHEQIHFDKIETKTGISYRTTFVKNRGNSIAEPIVDNWLRD